MIWLFDYDLTLYGYDESFVLDSLDRNITLFLETHLGLSKKEADSQRKIYCQKYGTTLGGLRAEHGITPEDYFAFIHSRESLKFPAPNPQLRQWLLHLPGRRAIFTNARADWMQLGIESMGIADCFDTIIDIESLQWNNKPDSQVYLLAEQQLGHPHPSEILFFDDKEENLIPARKRGWRTILVHPHATQTHAHWHVQKLLDFDPLWAKP